MKKILFLALLPTFLFAQEVDDQIFKLENDPPPFSPFAVSGSYVHVSPARFRNSAFEGQELIFRQWEIAFSYKHPFSPVWGLLFGSGWEGVEVNMQQNPEFEEKIFNYVNGLVGAYTTAFPGWLWKFTVSAFIDVEETPLVDYTLYQTVLWGKYDLCKWIELDFGFIAETGLRRSKVWPILGFVWIPAPKWTISAIYPIDISVNYSITPCLIASGSLRFLRSRHRLKDTEPNPQGIFEYRTTGAEFDLTYAPIPCFSTTGFVGSTGHGDLQVNDRNGKHGVHFKFNGSFYAGISALLAF